MDLKRQGIIRCIGASNVEKEHIDEYLKYGELDVIQEKYSMLDRSDISDMFEGAGIGVAFPLGSGHGLSYWSGRGNSKEIFAEITSAEAAHPGSLRAIKEYFPKTYQVYQDMLKARRKL